MIPDTEPMAMAESAREMDLFNDKQLRAGTAQEDGPPPEDSDEYEPPTTYLALEGIEPDRIDDEMREKMESYIEETIILNFSDLPIEGARVITGSKNVAEVLVTDADA